MRPYQPGRGSLLFAAVVFCAFVLVLYVLFSGIILKALGW